MLIEFQYPVFDPPLGGVENHIIQCARELMTMGHSCQVFCGPSRIKPENSEYLINLPSGSGLPLPIYRHKSLLPRGLGLFFRPLLEWGKLKDEMAQKRPRPDLIISRFPYYTLAAKYAFGRDCKIIYLPPVDMVKRQKNEGHYGSLKDKFFSWLFSFQWAYLEKKAMESCDIFMVLSKNMQFQMRAYSKRKAILNPGGIDLEKFHFDPQKRQKIRKAMNIPEDKLVFISLARLSPEKNISFALDLLSRIKLDFHYILAGEGDLLKELENKARCLGLADKISFIGLVDNPQDYLSAGDIFLHPGKEEAFGHVLLEAMAVGLPIFAASSKNGKYPVATQEILPKDGGLLLDLDDLKYSALMVNDILAKPDKLREMGQRGQKKAIKSYSWAKHCGKLLASWK